MTLVAGIDSSTQSCKIVISDAATGIVVRRGRAAHPVGTEVNPAAWWDALQAAIVDAGGLGGVSAISVAAQQHGMVVLDADGNVIRPALLWNDTRSAAAATDLISEVGAVQFAQRTGSLPVASFTITKLRWLRDAEPENAARVAAVALPHDWLTWRLRGYGPAGDSTLTGGTLTGSPLGPVLTELTTDRSDASGTGYFSSVTNDYDRDLLTRALGHDAILPRVRGAEEPAGTTPGGLIVGAGAGDNAAAALGLGASAGDIIVSIGTSGTVFAVTDQPTTDATGTVAGFADASGRFLPLVATLNAARVLDSVSDLLGVDFDGLGRLALDATPGADGLVLQPYFEGERTPNLPDATASLFGMTLGSTTRPNLARAAIEGLFCGLANGLDAVLALGVRADRILLIGGAAQNPAVQAIAAQVFDVPVFVPTPGEYVADGAAAQAAWAHSGARPSWSVSLAGRPAPDFHPVIRAQYAAHRI
ncbi:xylulokinase [Glaciibacter psychrotolerans]|uniref:Xylulose kinase n=1 Tax=Glaciibacter psychrotolerans TaxID=670054 RepID=A0A7Z0EGL9_9MICO|nr:FGGY family carbohydrate kinase [Leifsonia psychrotolerans]NYJ20534.1 xylulokinase [Leifsonia psychrotolerans]